jgi:hypothetical protein
MRAIPAHISPTIALYNKVENPAKSCHQKPKVQNIEPASKTPKPHNINHLSRKSTQKLQNIKISVQNNESLESVQYRQII